MTARLEALCPVCADGVTRAEFEELEEIAWDIKWGITWGDPGCAVCGDAVKIPAAAEALA